MICRVASCLVQQFAVSLRHMVSLAVFSRTERTIEELNEIVATQAAELKSLREALKTAKEGSDSSFDEVLQGSSATVKLLSSQLEVWGV